MAEVPPAPLKVFDLTPAIELALAMGDNLEKERPCTKCKAAQERLLRYFAESALPQFNFEIVRLVTEKEGQSDE